MKTIVVGDGIAGDVVSGVCLTDVAAMTPNNDGDLALVVKPLTAFRANHVGPMRTKRGYRLMKVSGRAGQFGHVFLDPTAVIKVHANDLAGLDRGKMYGAFYRDFPSIVADQYIAFTPDPSRVAIEQYVSEFSHYQIVVDFIRFRTIS